MFGSPLLWKHGLCLFQLHILQPYLQIMVKFMEWTDLGFSFPWRCSCSSAFRQDQDYCLGMTDQWIFTGFKVGSTIQGRFRTWLGDYIYPIWPWGMFRIQLEEQVVEVRVWKFWTQEWEWKYVLFKLAILKNLILTQLAYSWWADVYMWLPAAAY